MSFDWLIRAEEGRFNIYRRLLWWERLWTSRPSLQEARSHLDVLNTADPRNQLLPKKQKTISSFVTALLRINSRPQNPLQELNLTIRQDAESGWWVIAGEPQTGIYIAHPSLDVCVADILPTWRQLARIAPKQVPPVPDAQKD
jgi:hypothetical protein